MQKLCTRNSFSFQSILLALAILFLGIGLVTACDTSNGGDGGSSSDIVVGDDNGVGKADSPAGNDAYHPDIPPDNDVGDPDTGQTLECDEHSDCPDGMICDSDLCVDPYAVGCGSDESCPPLDPYLWLEEPDWHATTGPDVNPADYFLVELRRWVPNEGAQTKDYKSWAPCTHNVRLLLQEDGTYTFYGEGEEGSPVCEGVMSSDGILSFTATYGSAGSDDWVYEAVY